MFRFDITMRTGRRIYCHPVVMFGLRYEGENVLCAKAEFAVAKRIMKKAVQRNRVKRQMRAAYREIIRDGVLNDGIHLIFFYESKSGAPFAAIKLAMASAIAEYNQTRTDD